MVSEQRRDPREPVSLPIRFGGADALALNVSTSGMYLQLEGPEPMGTLVRLEVDLPEAGMRLDASGEIVRIEHLQGKTGIAVRLRDPKLRPM